ncbi:hypothetical protein L1856_04880 [Streptomyces sp. Tue 6430]|nr:hypothetical protein [Streptomyces sp. Tue 6430]
MNQGLATLFGHGGREHFLDPDLLAALADPDARHEELRRQVSKAMRDPDRDGTSPIPWPPVYGDAMSLPPLLPAEMLVESEVSFAAEPAPPRGRNLLSLHVPLAADERLREAVLATAVTLAEEPDEELSAGYIAKVARFPGNR